ncbi:MAG: Uncharacterised protein [Porticoccaceae bacterium UBA1117]|nr:MAG: Uncharacterised protein [Porticoccaceae bacterium UBA1117]
MTWGPLVMISPGSPKGISWVPVSRSTMRVSAPGTGIPTAEGMLRPSGLHTCTGPVSVIPNMSLILSTPIMSSMF